MKSTPDPPDHWRILRQLLKKLVEHFTAAIDLLAPVLPVLKEVREQCRKDLDARPKDDPDPARACLLARLDGIIEVLGQAKHRLDRANRIAKRAAKRVEACLQSRDEDDPPTAPTIRRLDLYPTVRGSDGRIGCYRCEIDGKVIKLPRVMGLMLMALADAPGEQTDNLVPFKSRARLAEIMESCDPGRPISLHKVSSRRNQLKNYLEEALGESADLIESDKEGRSRLRLEWPPPESNDPPSSPDSKP
ncbi:MAG: hypothetical protein HKN82_02110 [Akkermansiaceae bacterium]|nr:hypothetical protein [Akkermansiaceae bacterium]NNM29695.1 hypothetical protein [Akkermansiaceae bacterium]